MTNLKSKNKNYVETWAHISASPALGPISEAGPVRHQILWLLCIFLVHFWPYLNISRNILTSLKISEHLCSSLNTSEHLSHLQYLCRELNITAYQFPGLTVSFGHSLLIHTMCSQVPLPTCSWKWHPDTCQLGNPTNYDQCQPAVTESSQEHFEA